MPNLATKFKNFIIRNKEIIILIILVCIAYCNSLNNEFVSDDKYAILNNQNIGKIQYAISHPFSFIRNFFYFLITTLFTKKPLFYRIINIVFHLGCVLTTYSMVSFLTGRGIAFWAAALLAVHPLQVESVAWISGGGYAQYSFFLLMSMFLFIKSKNNARNYYLSFLFFILSIFSAEKAMIFPLMLLFLVVSFRQLQISWKKILPFVIISSIFCLIYIGKIGERINTLEKDFYIKPKVMNPFMQVPIAITKYLELIFWPKDLTLYHSELNFTFKHYYFLLAVFFLFILGLAVTFKKNKQVFFWLSFFVISLLPTLTPWGISWVVAERYVYLGSLGIYVAIATFFYNMCKKRKLKLTIYLFFTAILAALLARTISRNIEWKNEDNLWVATAKTSPSFHVTHNNLGDVYYRHKDFKKAVEEFNRAIEINPRYADGYHNLANTYLAMDRKIDAIENYKKAIFYNPKLWQSYENLAVIYYFSDEMELAKENYIEAIKINPLDSHLYLNLGAVYLNLNEKEKARIELEKALIFDAGNFRAREMLKEFE